MSGESRERNTETLSEFFGGTIVFLAGVLFVLAVIVCLTLLWW